MLLLMLNDTFSLAGLWIKRIKPKLNNLRTFATIDRLKHKKMVKYLTQEEAIEIDQNLFTSYKFSVGQLMELAGLSCAAAIARTYPITTDPAKVLVCCGPGNNGGDGLVCARHLKCYGYEPEILYPKKVDNELYKNLLHQCIENDITVLCDDFVEKTKNLNDFNVIVDALFGFSFKPPVKEPFIPVMRLLEDTKVPICSIDIPSGWHVEKGPCREDDIRPEMLISLTAPKLCARKYEGKYHYLGGRFVPTKLNLAYKLNLPKYPGTDLFVSLK